MADAYYQNLERTLRETRMHVHDSFSNPGDPRARVIYNELEKAENMAQGQQHLRSIEDHLKSVQTLLRQAEHDPSDNRVMNIGHADAHYHNLEHLRMDIRRQPHY